MAKRLAKKANAVKSSRKSETTKVKKIVQVVGKKPATKVTKKMISSVHKPAKKKATSPKKLVSVVKAKNMVIAKQDQVKTIKIAVKADTITKQKTQATKPIKTIVKDVKKPMPIIPQQEIVQEVQEDYMNADQQKHFRMVLLEWKKQLLGEMERTVHHMQDEAANFPDPNDRYSTNKDAILSAFDSWGIESSVVTEFLSDKKTLIKFYKLCYLQKFVFHHFTIIHVKNSLKHYF